MADPPTPSPDPQAGVPRWMRWLLVASLALNLLVAGVVVGDILVDGGHGHGPRPVEFGLGPLSRALDEGDRRAILGSLRGDPELASFGRDRREAGLAEIAAAVRAEPFDPERARAALLAQSEAVARVQGRVQDALVARLAAMTAEERAALADRLEAELARGSRRD